MNAIHFVSGSRPPKILNSILLHVNDCSYLLSFIFILNNIILRSWWMQVPPHYFWHLLFLLTSYLEIDPLESILPSSWISNALVYSLPLCSSTSHRIISFTRGNLRFFFLYPLDRLLTWAHTLPFRKICRINKWMSEYKMEKVLFDVYVPDRHVYYSPGLIFCAWVANCKHFVGEKIHQYVAKKE